MGGEFHPQELWVELKLSKNDSCASNNKQSVVPRLESPYKQGHANQLDKNLNISESPAQTWTESSLGFDENHLRSPNYIYLLSCRTSNLLLVSPRDEDAGAVACSRSVTSLDIPDLARMVRVGAGNLLGRAQRSHCGMIPGSVLLIEVLQISEDVDKHPNSWVLIQTKPFNIYPPWLYMTLPLATEITPTFFFSTSSRGARTYLKTSKTP